MKEKKVKRKWMFFSYRWETEAPNFSVAESSATFKNLVKNRALFLELLKVLKSMCPIKTQEYSLSLFLFFRKL